MGGIFYGFWAFPVIGLAFLVTQPLTYMIGLRFRAKFGSVERWVDFGVACACCLASYVRFAVKQGSDTG